MAIQRNRKDRFKHLQDDEDNAGDTVMSFEDIAEAMELTVPQVKMIFKQGMAKLSHPKTARELWNYDQIGTIAEDASSDGGICL